MTAVAFTAGTSYNNDAPGANSQATGSISHTTGRLYIVQALPHLGASTNPPDVTLTGWNITWAQLASNLYRASGTTRAKQQVFWGISNETTSSALTFTYTGVTLTALTVTIDYCLNYEPSDPIIEANSQTSGTQAYVGGATTSYFTMSALGNVDNRTWAACAINGNEAALDFEANYTDLTEVGSSTAPTRRTLTGWRNSATPDLTPAMTSTSSWTAGIVAIEVRGAQPRKTWGTTRPRSNFSNATRY